MLKKFFIKFDSPWAVVFLTAIFYGLFISILLFQNNYNFSYFVTAGDKFSDAKSIANNFIVQHNSWGFDGQFYYRLALDPFTRIRTDQGIMLDLPALRQQRIIYPMFAWLISFGKPSLVTMALVFINYVGLCIIAWLSGKILRLFNLNALWGILISFYPGFILVLARDLTEILAVCFLLLSLFFYKTNRYLLLTLALSLAVLTRETNLIFLVALFFGSAYLYLISKHKKYKLALFSCITPLVIFLFWHLYLYFVWGTEPLLLDSHFNIQFLPFSGLLFNLINLPTISQLYLLEIGFLFILALITIYCLKFFQADLIIKIAWIFYFILFLFLSKNIWVEDWTFLRILSDLYLFSIIIILTTNKKTGYFICAYVLFLWLRIFLRLT